MTKSGKTLFFFGIYLCVPGLLFLTIPQAVLPLLLLPPASDYWVRIAGLVLVLLASFYIVAGKNSYTAIARFSVPERIAVLLVLIILAALGIAPTPIIAFGVIDVAAALWTLSALRSEKA